MQGSGVLTTQRKEGVEGCGGREVKVQRAHEGKGEKGLLILKCQALPLGHILSQTVPQFLSLNTIWLRVSAPT